MRFSVLGDFMVTVADLDITPRPAKPRSILALLTVRKGESVTRDSIIREIWGESPPENASGAIHTYIYELRQALKSGGQIIVTKPHGYLLDTSKVDVDICRFDELMRRGTTIIRNSRSADSREALEEASDHFSEALALWRGDPLANVDCGEQLATHVTWLEERHRQALELRFEVDIRLGRESDLVGELKVLAERYPYHERFHEILMRALAGAGRRSESLEVYRRLRHRMTEEFGLEPSPPLQKLQHALLIGDQRFEQRTSPAVTARPRMQPTQLPPDVPDLCGRQDVVEEMCRYLTGPHGTTGPVVCLHGMAGVGKSTVAVAVANRLARHFPGGQIYLDLHGTRAGSSSASTLLGGLLRALGVADADVPSTVEECVGAFRSLTLDGRVLLVLDGVKPHLPVARLLPAACATIITSRWPMHGIAGARKISLDAFGTEEALTLLGRIAGEDRIRAERDIAEGIIDRVGGLPLVVRFLGERLSSAPAMSLEQLWSLMVAAGDEVWLSDLGRIGFDLYDRLDATYRELNAAERAAVRVLGPFRHGKFTTRDVADAMASPVTQADLVVTSLVDASLVHAVGHDEQGDRVHALPQLVGLYAMELAERRL